MLKDIKSFRYLCKTYLEITLSRCKFKFRSSRPGDLVLMMTDPFVTEIDLFPYYVKYQDLYKEVSQIAESVILTDIRDTLLETGDYYFSRINNENTVDDFS